MNKRKIIVSILFFFLSFYLSAPAGAKETASAFSSLFPHENSDLKPDPNLIFGKLSNGFRYVLMKNHEPKERVSIQLDIQAGSLHETDDQQGIAHYMEHMIFNGSEHFASGELIKYFQSIGMSFGPDANGHTSFDETVYNILLPDGNKESLEKGLLVMQNYAGGALLPESEIDRERGIILAEKQLRDSVGYRTYVATMKFLFAGSRIPERLPIGTEEDIKNADRKILKDYYDTWYRPEKMILVLVGDTDTGMAESLIKSSFSKLTSRAAARICPNIGIVFHEGIKIFYHYEKEAGNTGTSIQVVRNREPIPDSLEYQKERLTQYVANTILNNRFKAMTENPENPFTAANAFSGTFLNTLAYAEIGAESSPENWKKVLMLTEQSLRQAIRFGFTQPELDRVKKELLADLENAVLKKDTRDSSGLSTAIIKNLNDNSVFQSPEQEKKLYAPIIESLTPGQVHDAFVKLWDQNHRLISVTGNADLKGDDKGVQCPLAQIQSVFDESAKTEVKKPAQEETVKFPYLPEPEKPGEILRQKEFSDLGIEQIDFKNGIRLNLKPTDFKQNEIIATISFGFGKKTEPVPGLALLAESLINKSGLGRLTRSDLDRALAGKKTKVTFSIDENSFLLKGETISEEIELLFQLFYAYVKDPGYRQEAYQLVMRQFRQMYKEIAHSIEGAMEFSGNRFLAGGDKRFGMPRYAEFQKLTLEQVRSWMESVKESSLEISVVGDFDSEMVRKLAAQYFGSLSDVKTVKDKKESLTFPAGERLVIGVETKINKAMAVIAWQTEDFSNIYRVRRLSALGHIFSERLREEIREKSALSYSQYAYNQSSRTYDGYGLFRTVVSTDPDTSKQVIQEIHRIASELVKDGITEDELRRAIDPILTSIKDMVRTNAYWLDTVLTRSVRYPEQLEWTKTIQQDYAAITLQDIADLAKTYLENKKAATIFIKPISIKGE